MFDYEAGTWVRFPVVAGLLTGYSVLGGSLTGYCYQQFGLDWIIGEVIDTHSGLCWKNKLIHPYQVGTFVDYPC